jgi:hypothetical protein
MLPLAGKKVLSIAGDATEQELADFFNINFAWDYALMVKQEMIARERED